MDQHTLRAVFFDLDGTLLPLDMDRFMGGYYLALKGFVAERGYDPKAFSDALNAGIYAMAGDHPGVTNCECFWSVFLERMGSEDAETWQTMLDEFYERDFGEIGSGMPPEPLSAEVVETLRAKGYPVALTTMPMFPLAAVHERIRWAGLDPDDFEFATDYETCYAAKPMPRYYEDCLARAGVAADEVLMVGNHNREDGLATKVGCDIYFVTDHLIESEEGLNVSECKHGSMAEFADWCEALPSLK